MSDIFSPAIGVSLFFAILDRPSCDTDVDYVRAICEQILAGTLTHLTIEGVSNMIKDDQAAPLKYFMTKDQHVAGASVAASYRVLTEDEEQKKMLDMASSGVFPPNLQRMIDEANVSALNKEDEEDEADEQQQQQPDEGAGGDTEEVPWVPRLNPLPATTDGYTWFYTVFYRVNGAFKLHRAYLRANAKDRFLARKMERFQEAHLRMVQYLDSMPDPSDVLIDAEHLVSLYAPLGESHYNSDASLIKVHQTVHKLKPTPLEIICAAYPDEYWLPEEVAADICAGTFDCECLTHLLDGEWAPLGAHVPAIRTHALYYGVIYVANMAREYMLLQQQQQQEAVRDALWAYYVSFLDFFCCISSAQQGSDAFLLMPMGSEMGRDHKLIRTDNATPWELYGTMDTRAFTAGDLPNFYHVLASIPLWGEQHTPSYFLGKIYQKSLPFACQRRHIIRLVIECIDKHAGFWRIFSKMCWVMLANLYPGELACKTNTMTMRDLMRVKQLTDSRELLLAAMTANQGKKAEGANGGPLVVFTVFRLHILYMASFNPQFVEHAKKCIDWEYFKRDVLKLADIVRSQNLFPDDPFSRARMQLSKTVKSPHSKVHRLRRKSLSICLMDQLNDALEKTILKDRQIFSSDLPRLSAIRAGAEAGQVPSEIKQQFKDTVLGAHIAQAHKSCFESMESFSEILNQTISLANEAALFYRRLLDVKYKAPLLNMLIRMQPHERATEKAFSMLMRPEYGGISPQCVTLLCDLVRIYHAKAVPKEFKQSIDKMSMPHFMVACFYFNTLALLDRINFVPLDAETTRRIDQAVMTRRHHLSPGQEVPSGIFNVSVALCCEKICTLMGSGKNGDKRVAYDIDAQAFVCAHGKSLKRRPATASAASAVDDAEDDEDDKKAAADDDDDDNSAPDKANILLAAQNDTDLDFDLSALSSTAMASDLTADAATMKGKGTKRSIVMQERKAVRIERKTFSKVPCGQPVLTFSLRGRALIWGNTLENKTQVMFCPTCGALHVYSMLNFSESETGDYRCNECARKEVMHLEHRRCAYCQRVSVGPPKEPTWLEVLCPAVDPTDASFDPISNPTNVFQQLNFCRAHYNIARPFVLGRGGVTKHDLWKLIKYKQDQKTLLYANKH